jgi:hypothetical protein
MEYSEQQIRQAIASRLQGLARTVGRDKDINVSFGINVAEGFPAKSNVESKKVFIDSNNPVETDSIRALILHKSKLYHELAHLKHTTYGDERARFASRSQNRELFLSVSNILEDGRIERLFVDEFPGTAPYFAYILSYFSPDGQPINDLAFRVRSDRYVHESTRLYFEAVEQWIEKAIHADNSYDVLVAADRIVNSLPQTPVQSSNCYSKPQADATPEQQEQAEQSNEKSDESDENGQEQQGKSSSGESDDNEDTGDGADGDSGDSDGDSEADGDTSDDDGDSDDNSDKDSGNGAGNSTDKPDDSEETKPHDDKPLTGEELRQQIVNDLKNDIIGELSEELELADIEIKNRNKSGQKFADASEATEANSLTQVFRQLQTQAKQVSWTPAYRTGRIESRRVTNIVTGGSFLKRRGKVNDKRPAVVTVIDTSCSMVSRIDRAARAARIVNGAVLNAKLDSAVISFDSHVKNLADVPLKMYAPGSATMTGFALEAAHSALKARPEPRKLIIIITDGCPAEAEIDRMPLIRDALVRDGIYVAAVILGFGDGTAKKLPFADFCDSVFYEPDNISQQLTELLRHFTR